MMLPNDNDPNFISKSQVKRDMTALQKLGETLVELPLAQLAQIPLPEQLFEAIRFAQTMKANEAKRRQLQYIGKLMREVDSAPIYAAIENLRLSHLKNTQQLHKAEKWRDQLIAEGDSAIQKLLETTPNLDRQHLRQLVRNAQHDSKLNKNSGAATELFRYLRDVLVNS
ncbi:MAG TPA: ribosome biogenesis factor YjgA [Gammaproteobacteria bacterium]|nr:ribosome biogenesis factor YjgA [Gammaproteobacteria bacterium]